MLFNSGLEHAMRNWKQSLKSHGLHVGAGKIDVKKLLWSHQKWNASRPSLPVNGKKLRINLERMRSTIRQFQEVTSFRSVIRSPSAASGAMMRIFAFSVSTFVARFVTLTALAAAT